MTPCRARELRAPRSSTMCTPGATTSSSGVSPTTFPSTQICAPPGSDLKSTTAGWLPAFSRNSRRFSSADSPGCKPCGKCREAAFWVVLGGVTTMAGFACDAAPAAAEAAFPYSAAACAAACGTTTNATKKTRPHQMVPATPSPHGVVPHLPCGLENPFTFTTRPPIGCQGQS